MAIDLRHEFTSLLTDAGANVAAIFALAMVPICTFVGVAVDFSTISMERAQLQNALDAAVLWGVKEAADNTKMSTAATVFKAQASNKFGPTPTATFSVTSGQLGGTAQETIRTTFLGIVGINSVQTTVTSTAAIGSKRNAVCVLLVDPTAGQSFLANSGTQLNGPSCEIDVDSASGGAGMINSGTALDIARVCIKGSATQNGGPYPVVTTGCQAISNPFVDKLPSVSAAACDYNSKTFNPGSVTLQPGIYCGWTNFNGSGTLTLDPGLYVVKNGGMTFNSGWTVNGSGVTFYLVDQNATLTFNANVNVSLSAPATGPYANILMFEPDGLNQTNLALDGTAGSSYSGLIYLPSRKVTVNSTSNVSANQITMVFASLILDSTNWTMTPGPLSPISSAVTSGGPYLMK